MAEQPYKGRSSIRNTNSSKNFTDNMNETTKSNKRVSFSSRNRVKTFVKGTETTQWDTTYEEAANHIDSTQSSQESTNKSLDKSYLPSFSNTEKIEGSLIDFIKQTQQQQSVEINHGNDNANQTVLNGESISMELEVIDRTTQIYVNNRILAKDKENLPLQATVISDNLGITNSTDMELTYPSRNLTDINMEITCKDTTEIVDDNQQEIVNKTALDVENLSNSINTVDDMEFTCRLPQITDDVTTKSIEIPINYGANKTDMELTCQQEKIEVSVMENQQILNTIHTVDEDMEFTCRLPKLNENVDNSPLKSNKIIQKIAKFDMSKDGNPLDSINTLEDMEFTCRLPKLVEISENSVDDLKKIDKSLMENRNLLNSINIIENMEFTCRSPQITDKFVSKSISYMANKTDMEPICQQEKIEKSVLESGQSSNPIETVVLKVGENLMMPNEKKFELEKSKNLDVDEMEWNPITPERSINKTMKNENTNGLNTNETIRKRSLFSSFLPFDSPQIIKKPTLLNNNDNLTPKSMNNDDGDIKRKSKIPTPISGGKAKQQLTPTPSSPRNKCISDENTPIIENRKILYSQKIDTNLMKNDAICDLTDIKTPDKSHMKLMSPCIDDTQQLIGATFTVALVEQDLTKLETTTTINKLQQQIDLTLPDTTQISIDDVRRNYSNVTDISFQANRLFQNINNTFVVNKMSTNNNDNDGKYEKDVYLDDCSIELVTSINNDDDADNDYDFPLTRKLLEEIQITECKFEIDNFPIIDIKKKQQEIVDFIDNFEFQSFVIPTIDDMEKLMDNMKLKYEQRLNEKILENHSIIEISDSVDNETLLEKKIRTLANGRDERIWQLIEINNLIYQFRIVFNKIDLIVQLDGINENVANITLNLTNPDNVTNLLKYLYKAIEPKLNISNVQLSLGQSSVDLIGFLQYLEMIVEKYNNFIEEFATHRFYDPTFNEDCWLSFKIRDPKMMKFFIISINLLNIENLIDDDVKVTSIFGNCNVKRLRKIAKKCSKLPKFLHKCIKTIEEYGI